MTRFAELQKNRTLVHPQLPQTKEHSAHDNDDDDDNFEFVVTADPQFGILQSNTDWRQEMEYSRRAVRQINALQPRPLFCCVCGDLVHMTAEIYAQASSTYGPAKSRRECDEIQDKQNQDFTSIWSQIHEDIPLVCLCGNHDVGDRPTPVSIARFRKVFGDDYLAFWARKSYNIVLNTSLCNDPSGAPELLEKQMAWLQDRLQYAQAQQASHIFVFGHHPWFLYDETDDKLVGESSLQEFGMEGVIKDDYFVIPLPIRKRVLALFQEYGVSAAFAGHFHQNMVSQTSWGMPMIVTTALSVLLKSTGIPKDFDEPQTRGMRIVSVHKNGSFQHRFVVLDEE